MQYDFKKLTTAQEWIQNLANGINPLDGSIIPDSDIVNNVHISRCLFYVADIINFTIQKKEKKSKATSSFDITADELERVSILERTTLSYFVREINSVISENIKPLSRAKVSDWLLANNYLKEVVTLNGSRRKEPTLQGISIGISTEERQGANGNYTVVVYNADAQRFILNNIYAIIES